jgi:hypothetical protein
MADLFQATKQNVSLHNVRTKRRSILSDLISPIDEAQLEARRESQAVLCSRKSKSERNKPSLGKGTGNMRSRAWGSTLATALAFLSGCQDGHRTAFEDFYRQQNRVIPAQERFRDVLLNLLKTRTTYEKRFADRGGVHFFKYFDDAKRMQPRASDAEIAERYVVEYPECCTQERPTYQRDHWIDDAYDDVMGWAVDVRVWRLLPPTVEPAGKRSPKDQFVRAADGCNSNITYVGGINGILE